MWVCGCGSNRTVHTANARSIHPSTHTPTPGSVAGFPAEAYSTNVRSTALADYLARMFVTLARREGDDQRTESGGYQGKKGGELTMEPPSQHVLPRTNVIVRDDGSVEARFTCALPARGRSIEGAWAAKILCERLPHLISSSLVFAALDGQHLRRHILSVEDQEHLRQQLRGEGLVAFVRNGAILPRKSGKGTRTDDAHVGTPQPSINNLTRPGPIHHPDRRHGRAHGRAHGHPLPVATRPRARAPGAQRRGRQGHGHPQGYHAHRRRGLPRCGTRHVNPLYPSTTRSIANPPFTPPHPTHASNPTGKSTLLKALEVGVYNHVPGDGRDGVVVDPTAVKIRAEDGRAITKVNVSPFINNLPFGTATDAFSTPDASGSTSQAANIIEALEVGAELLLMDEDLCATNFMIRDEKMMMLVAKDKEPITPFLAKAKALADAGTSCILVMGGSGDYFSVADCVVMMDAYKCLDKTAEAKAIAQQFSAAGSALALASGQPFGALSGRSVQPGSALQTGGKVMARGKEKISYGDHDIDLGAVEQLVEVGQTRAIGAAMRLLGDRVAREGGQATLRQLVEAVEGLIDGAVDGMDGLEPNVSAVGNMARPRKFELAAAINRFRVLAVSSQVVGQL